jgi:hypothetical protein
MKKSIILLLFFCTVSIFGQKNEFQISLDSGLFSYTGVSATDYSSLNVFSENNTAKTNNPFGSKNGLCFGGSFNVKRVAKGNMIYGIGLGYQFLKSKVCIESVFDNTIALPTKVSGQTYLINTCFNVYPSIGKRVVVKKIPIDLVGGLNFDFILNTKEKGNAKDSQGIEYSSNRSFNTIKFDFGPRIQLSTEYKKTGLYLGYSVGLLNYMSGYVGGENQVYSKMLRFGFTYRLK